MRSFLVKSRFQLTGVELLTPSDYLPQMRALALFLALLFSGISGNAAPFFKVRFSQPLAAYLFVEALSGNGRPGNAYQKSFISSRFDTPKNRLALADFDTLNLNYAYSFDDYPPFSKMPGQTDALLRRALLLSNDLNDFKDRATGILPQEDFVRLLHTLRRFAPVYDTLIYQPQRQGFEMQLAACTQKLNTPAVSDFFRKMALFYGQKGAGNDTFHVAFYPLPKSRSFQATAFADCSVSALPEGESDYDVLLSVTLHEIAHILYDNQSRALKERLQSAFRESKYPGAWNGYLLLNEALATALGNGVAYEKLHGGLDTGAWYNNKYRNAMGKAIHPIVVDYLSKEKTIDDAFVAEYCRIYAMQFPQWEAEAAHLFTNRFVLADDYESIRLVDSAFPVTFNTHAATPINRSNLEKMRETPLTKVLILDPKAPGRRALAREIFPEIKALLSRPKAGFMRLQMPDKTWLYVLPADARLLKETLGKL